MTGARTPKTQFATRSILWVLERYPIIFPEEWSHGPPHTNEVITLLGYAARWTEACPCEGMKDRTAVHQAWRGMGRTIRCSDETGGGTWTRELAHHEVRPQLTRLEKAGAIVKVKIDGESVVRWRLPYDMPADVSDVDAVAHWLDQATG